MRYFTLGSMMAMVALSFSLAQPAQAYIFGLSNGDTTDTVLRLNGGAEILQATDTGWYRNGLSPIHDSALTNYLVAQPNDFNAAEYRNFFVFDISELSNITITSATLTLQSYDVTSIFETYKLFDVTTDIHTLIDGNPVGTFTPSAFTDLGSGEIYGSRDYGLIDDNQERTIFIDANSAFFDNLNAAIAKQSNSGRFAMGGALVVDTSTDFPITVPPGTYPDGAVPEPSTLLLLGLALVGLAAWRRKHAA